MVYFRFQHVLPTLHWLDCSKTGLCAGTVSSLWHFNRDDTSGEDAEDKEPTVAFKGRRTANSQGRRKGRITRSMTSEVEETTTPPLNNELGQYRLITFRVSLCTVGKDEAYSYMVIALVYLRLWS